MGNKTDKKETQIAIIGRHPLVGCIAAQYNDNVILAVGDDVEKVIGCSEIFVLNDDCQNDCMATDSESIRQVQKIASLLKDSDIHPTIHLLLHCPTSFRLLQTARLNEEIGKCVDLLPFTMEDIWARNILVHLPKINDSKYPPLDRTPIGANSKQTVHVVISGFNNQAEAVALHVALVAHYPNYHSTDEKPLRTRITIIDKEMSEKRDEFISRYQHLFDNSYYRTVNVIGKTVSLHKPMYSGQRLEFVDVEWEFVDGELSDAVVREHLKNWACNSNKQLSLVIAHDDDHQNLKEATSLPYQIYDNRITVFVRQKDELVISSFKNFDKFAALYPFGMTGKGYDVRQPLVRLAKLLNYFYKCSYQGLGIPTELPIDEVEKAWQEELSLENRFSSTYSVMTIATKMHSLGHEEADNFYAMTQKELDILAPTEHNRWSVVWLFFGNRPCTDEERKEIDKDIKKKRWYNEEKDVHYDLVAFEELKADETGKNVRIYDYDLTACIPLMAKTFFDRL